MGAWGIRERQSDYGLDLLDTIIATQLKTADFAVFNVAEALDVITADIMEEIRKANRGCSAEKLVFYFGSAEKVIFSECFRNGGKKVAYFRGLVTN